MQDQGCKLVFNPIPNNDKVNFPRELGELKLLTQQLLLSCRWHLKKVTRSKHVTAIIKARCDPLADQSPQGCAAQGTEPRSCPAGRGLGASSPPPCSQGPARRGHHPSSSLALPSAPIPPPAWGQSAAKASFYCTASHSRCVSLLQDMIHRASCFTRKSRASN